MERDLGEGGEDPGREPVRDFGDEPPVLLRDAPPDILAPIDADAPVSGHHVAPPGPSISLADTPEHDWDHARDLIRPAFRPVGTHGLALDSIDPEVLAKEADKRGSQPVIDEGPAGLPVVYTFAAGSFDIVVNADHLLSWGVAPSALQDAALANLAAWSATAAWSDEESGQRRLISSDTGEGLDAVRILLPEVQDHLVRELGPRGRILIGLPDRHLMTAASLAADDSEFAQLFADFVVEQSGGADEPIDRRVFELVGGHLVEFAG